MLVDNVLVGGQGGGFGGLLHCGEKNTNVNYQKVFFGKNLQKSSYFEEKIHTSPCLDNEFI